MHHEVANNSVPARLVHVTVHHVTVSRATFRETWLVGRPPTPLKNQWMYCRRLEFARAKWNGYTLCTQTRDIKTAKYGPTWTSGENEKKSQEANRSGEAWHSSKEMYAYVFFFFPNVASLPTFAQFPIYMRGRGRSVGLRGFASLIPFFSLPPFAARRYACHIFFAELRFHVTSVFANIHKDIF